MAEEYGPQPPAKSCQKDMEETSSDVSGPASTLLVPYNTPEKRKYRRKRSSSRNCGQNDDRSSRSRKSSSMYKRSRSSSLSDRESRRRSSQSKGSDSLGGESGKDKDRSPKCSGEMSKYDASSSRNSNQSLVIGGQRSQRTLQEGNDDDDVAVVYISPDFETRKSKKEKKYKKRMELFFPKETKRKEHKVSKSKRNERREKRLLREKTKHKLETAVADEKLQKDQKSVQPTAEPEPNQDVPMALNCNEVGDKNLEKIRKNLKPMSLDEWKKQQAQIRKVYDPISGRDRLVRGDGEIIEEIVSKQRQKVINKAATAADGACFQSTLMKKMQ